MAYMGGNELQQSKNYFEQVYNDIVDGNEIKTKFGYFKFELTKELTSLYKKKTSGHNIVNLIKDGTNFRPIFIDTKTNSSFSWSTIEKTHYSVGDSVKPSTKQQENITLKIFEYLLTETSNISFDKFIENYNIEKIWKDIRLSNDWYNSFKLQYDEIYKETKLKNGSYTVFDRDGGLMDNFTEIARLMGFSKKDAWDPADIWLSKKDSKVKKIITRMKEKASLQGDGALPLVNTLLRLAFKSGLILGISLKKNDGKKLHYDLVNLKYDSSSSSRINGKFIKYHISNEFIGDSYKLVSSVIKFKYNQYKPELKIRRHNQSKGNIIYEFAESSAAQLGKVPIDQLNKITKSYVPGAKIITWHDLPQKVDNIKDNEWKGIFSKLNISPYIKLTEKKTPEEMLADMKASYNKSNGKLNKDNIPTLMIYKFAYVLAQVSSNKIDEYITDLYFAAQKKGSTYGGFGKLY